MRLVLGHPKLQLEYHGKPWVGSSRCKEKGRRWETTNVWNTPLTSKAESVYCYPYAIGSYASSSEIVDKFLAEAN